MTPNELHTRNLEAALLAITTEAGKVGYLYPAPKRALAAYIGILEQENERLKQELATLQNKIVRMSGITKPQPFHMVVEDE